MPVSTTLISGHNNKSGNSPHRRKSSLPLPVRVRVTPALAEAAQAKCDLERQAAQAQAVRETQSRGTATATTTANENVITKSLIPINFPLDLNLSLNCVLLQPPPNSSCGGPASQQNSPVPSTSTPAYSNSLSISSISSSSPVSSTSSASASPSSCYSSSSGFCDGSGSGGHGQSKNKTCTAGCSSSIKKYRLSIVKIEEEQEQEGESADEDGEEGTDKSASAADVTLVQVQDSGSKYCKKEKEEEENSAATSSYCLSTTADCECDWDLDFDDVDFDECNYDNDNDTDITERQGDNEIDDEEDGDGDTDVEVSSSCCIVSPATISITATACDSNSNSNSNSNSSFSPNKCVSVQSSGAKKRKKHQTHCQSQTSQSQVKPNCHTKSDEEHSDESEYLSLENPNPVPCIHCQDNKEHSVDESVIWPIQLDLDLVETLFQLCPEFFGDFKEEAEEMDQLTAESSMDDTDDVDAQFPSTSTSTSGTHGGDGEGAAGEGAGAGSDSMDASAMDASPPHVQVDDSPLQNSMDRNKESLKVKLLLRRPMNQLVEQGILPPPKTPPAFAGQRVRLERARMGDLLKAKIQQRPARQELIRQHILEDSNARVAPALAEKQRMLKKARLADSLNDHLIHRPGPLELVQKNILHAPDATIDQAIKEGAVCFKATSEGHIPGPQLPHSYLSEDDSSSDMSSPAGTPDQSQSSSSDSSKATDISNASASAAPSQEQASPTSTTNAFVSPAPVSILAPAPPPPPPMPLQKLTPASASSSSVAGPSSQMQNQMLSRIVQAAVTSSTVPPLTSAQLTLSKLSQLDQSQINTIMNQNHGQRAFLVAQGINFNSQPAQQQHACASKSRSSKKSSKPKSQPKARQIKFHEYKGPPSAHKGQQQSQQNEVESSYELLLQQQQLFLQWQLEWQHKYPQIILPAVSKLTSPTEATAKLLSSITTAGATLSVHPAPPPVTTASISSVPTVLSPSTISSVPNQSVLQNIAAAPPAPIPVSQPQQFIRADSQPANKQQTPANNNTSAESAAGQVQSVSVTFAPVSIVPKVEPKSNDSQPSNSTKTETAAEKSEVGLTSNPLTKTKSLSKLSEWKVNDLKAELKKRNLPVSGSKPQLIERLKLADLNLQDESISTTTHSTNSNANSKNILSQSNSAPIIKTEAPLEEVATATCYEMMDVSDTQPQEQGKAGGNDPKVRSVKMDIKPVAVSSSSGSQLTANAAIMALLQNNNIKLNPDGTLPAYVLNALASVIKKPDPKSASSTDKGAGSQQAPNIVFVDEAVIREQRKHIEQLQEELKNSQQQLLQMKSQQGGGQKHRLALQQHLQHKMQQQALQAQLQKLQIQLQLHSLQQQQQQQNQNQSQSAKQPAKMQLSQVSTKIQPQFPHVQIVSQHPQRAVPGVPGSSQYILTKAVPGNSQSGSENSKHIPYAIVKIAANTTTQLQSPENERFNSSNVPEIIIPDRIDASFQAGKKNSSQGSTTIPVPQVPADQTDQSWLLKIDELKGDSKDKDLANFFDSVVGNNVNANGQNKELQIQSVSSDIKPKKKNNVKSQMVDDVLEILIRHGELPPSAAQEPPTPTTPGKSPSILNYPIPSADGHGYVPPPPPLPPATFAVTLPTSISFPKPSTASVFSGHGVNSAAPSTSADNNTSKASAIPTEILSKEAQDILKISEDLSNFGKAHAENENHVLSPFMFSNFKPSQNLLKLSSNHMSTDDDNLSMLLGEVEKDLHLVDDMDVALDDHHHHSSHELHMPQVGFQNTSSQHMPHSTSMHDNLNQQNFSSQRPTSTLYNGLSADGIRASEEFLEELGTLIPDDIDVTMPMEMDYSEWFEDLLPADNNNIAGTSFNGDSLALSPFPNNTSTDFSRNSGGDGMSTNNNVYGMDFNSGNISNLQRDPLLSSQSLNIFSSIPQSAGGGSSCANSTLNALNTHAIDVKSGTNRAPSPMAMGNDSLLWDFA